MAKTKPQFVGDPVNITASAPANIVTPDIACETCSHWERKPRTGFGVCYKFQDILVESRDGVSAAPFTPITPELAACHSWQHKT